MLINPRFEWLIFNNLITASMTDNFCQLILIFDVQVNDVDYYDDFWKLLVKISIKLDKLSGITKYKTIGFSVSIVLFFEV